MLWHSVNAPPSVVDADNTRIDHHQREARKTFNEIGKTLLPWYTTWDDDANTLAEQWKAFKQREKDPEYAKYLKGLRDKLRAMRKDAKEGSAADKAAHENLKALREKRRGKGKKPHARIPRKK